MGCLFLDFLVPFFFFCSLVIWWLSSALCLDSFLFLVYTSNMIFGFWIPWSFYIAIYKIGYKYHTNNIYMILLNCWSLNFKCLLTTLHLYCPPLMINVFWYLNLHLVVLCIPSDPLFSVRICHLISTLLNLPVLLFIEF